MTITVAQIFIQKTAVQRDAMFEVFLGWMKPAATRPPLLLDIASLSLGHSSATDEAGIGQKAHPA